MRKFFPYLLTTTAVLLMVVFGSMDKAAITDSKMDMESIANNNYSVTVDQISQFFIVAELASSMNLPTAEAVNLNYNSLTTLKSISNSPSDKLGKSEILDTSHLARGITSYTVKSGETVDQIATQHGITPTQLRWSNNLRNTEELAAGQILYLPSVPGIVHKVKEGDTIASLAEKYKSNPEDIISVNDLENNTNLSADSVIILPMGELPETERPEYARQRHSHSAYYAPAYRIYWTSANPMPWGWCTWYVWGKRAQMGGNYVLPGGLGNANTWDRALAGSFRIDRTPSVGSVFQTYAGSYYGHVGMVDAVHPNGDITISDMNGVAGWGAVGSKRISREIWSQYKFIHERR